LKKRYKILISIVVLILLGFGLFAYRVIYKAPNTPDSNISLVDLEVINDHHFKMGNSWLRKNKNGNWESYIEGSAYDRGRTMGILHDQLIKDQEQIFVDEINKNVPSWFLREAILLGIAWFNRDLNDFIPEEYLQEIYGISEFFSDDYDYIGPKFNRILNYHAAHDIGHAVQNMHLVGCTSVGAWNFTDSTEFMLSGRNFDFYFGDDFAKDKIVLLINPDQGYKYLSVTWGGFTGVVSGMNEQGLSITLNSAISEIPTASGTPVSIIARDILQYASTIDEAITIARKYESFVSEMFTISSLNDKKMAVIEKSPITTGIFHPNSDTLIVANHYQSNDLKFLQLNLDHMENSESVERYARAEELIMALDTINPNSIASILRDQSGLGEEAIGAGNPKCINQLLAHHSVLFDNVNKTVWVSNYPYQENVFDAYTLNDFDKWVNTDNFPITMDSLQIDVDPFYTSNAYETFMTFKQMKQHIIDATDDDLALDDTYIYQFVDSNPEYYETYRLLGNYFFAKEDFDRARVYYETALDKNIAYQDDKVFIESQLEEINL